MARFVTITTIAWHADAGQDLAAAAAAAEVLLRQAAASRPDLVLFPELCLHADGAGSLVERAESLPNAVTKRFGRLAQELGANIALGLPVREGDRVFNSVVTLDRRTGQPAGRYDKRYPTIGELESGIAPGRAAAAFELDIGRIGHLICFDLNFIERAVEMQALDLDLLCFHSMYAGGPLLEQWALTVGCPIVSAYRDESRAVDMTGVELARTGYRYEQHSLWQLPPLLTVRLNLDRRLFHGDFHYLDPAGEPKLHRLLREQAGRVTVDHVYPASLFALGALDDLSLPELIERYELETRNQYLKRARARLAFAVQPVASDKRS